MSIQLLDCTLRDGWYVNDWRFGKKVIPSILEKLEKAHIDIIECGFLTSQARDDDQSLFNRLSEIENILPPRRESLYVAMIAIGEKEMPPAELPPYDGKSIGGIRLTFHKGEVEQAIRWAGLLMEKGYRVFMQPVGTVFYTDIELLRLVEKMNALKPYAFYIVDTLGSMYRNEVSHRFYLIDENMAPDIHLGFHGHNNLQLAFSNAQVLGKIQTKRTLILDSSVYGMGRGAGNLPTELITQYINKNIDSRYDVTMVMDIYDEYIAPIRREAEWGYTIPYHIAASHVCHPNYAAYLLNKRTLTMRDIETIIQSIPPESKVLFDKKRIERLYTQFQSRKIDDSRAVADITQTVRGRKILLLAPGKSLLSKYDAIMDFIGRESPYVISINFVDPAYRMQACFVSNHKRMDSIEREIPSLRGIKVILTSNLPEGGRDWLYVDYARCTNDDELVSDNAGLMLLKLLERCGVRQVFLAGFDGFHHRHNGNYYSRELNFKGSQEDVYEKQAHIRRQLQKQSETMQLTFLTPSVYERDDTPEKPGLPAAEEKGGEEPVPLYPV